MKSHSLAPRLNAAGLKSLDSARHAPDFSDLWQRVVKFFNVSGLLHRTATFLRAPAEPQIYKRHDRRGKVYFRLYDPRTDQHRVFSSEEDLRIWFDQRY